MSDIADPSLVTDSDTLGVSFWPDFDATNNSNSGNASTSTRLTNPKPSCLPDNCSRLSTHIKWPIRHLADIGVLPDFSDDPNNDTDKDLADILLDYRRSDQTKIQGRQIEKRWHKWVMIQTYKMEVVTNTRYRYCGVKAAQSGAFLKWDNLEEALHKVTLNDIYWFFNYCIKLKYSEDSQYLKGILKASALKAD